MTQRDYDLISRLIDEETGILISVSTIKRLIFGDFTKMPQIATLNAIAIYLGYKNWNTYKLETVTIADNYSPENNKTQLTPIENPFRKTILKWKLLELLGVACVTILFGIFSLSSIRSINFDKAEFTIKRTTQNSIPNSVIFNYNVESVDADSFFIQQSWDRSRRVKIPKNGNALTDIYYEPGFHIAKLYANNQIIKTIGVKIPTKDWFFYAKSNDFSSLPTYLKVDNYVSDGKLGINRLDLMENKIEMEVEKYYYYTFYPLKSEVNSENFSFKTRIKMNPVKDNYCPFILYDIGCEKQAIFFKSMNYGCEGEGLAQFGEVFADGKNMDLSALAYDPTQWNNVEILVKENQVTIFFNKKKVFSYQYKQSAGSIEGFAFISNGLCEIDYLELNDLNGNVFYKNQFDKQLQ
ncbi:MAG: hypothetical protein V4683_08735 [Bacteroidota bacterium]